MKPFTKVLLAICLLGFALGFADIGNSMFSGVARALGAVFFILTFLCFLFDKMEAQH
jgi:uncharacterized membrane protein YadS